MGLIFKSYLCAFGYILKARNLKFKFKILFTFLYKKKIIWKLKNAPGKVWLRFYLQETLPRRRQISKFFSVTVLQSCWFCPLYYISEIMIEGMLVTVLMRNRIFKSIPRKMYRGKGEGIGRTSWCWRHKITFSINLPWCTRQRGRLNLGLFYFVLHELVRRFLPHDLPLWVAAPVLTAWV